MFVNMPSNTHMDSNNTYRPGVESQKKRSGALLFLYVYVCPNYPNQNAAKTK